MTGKRDTCVTPMMIGTVSLFLVSGWLARLQAQTIDFEKQIAPILISQCLECHQGDMSKGGLDLTQSDRLHQGGESGAAIVVGDANGSLLWARVSNDEMPPNHPLSDEQKETLRQWIDQGAIWGGATLDRYTFTTDTRGGRDWWSFQPLNRMSVPAVDPNWGRNEIDAFVGRRLREEGLQPSPVADPRNLLRRLYFDLVGLPPTPDEVAAFIANPSDAAYMTIVDELLNSPHYGERWGRHWLDVVRFGESDGYERNFARENAWHYRDWVIQALNADMPYDEFVRMQLIGDLMGNERQGVAATGFWVAGVHNTVVGGSKRMKQLARQDEFEEVLGTLGQTLVGLTFNCARCHDHKFDPITQVEYYQLASSISGLGFGERDVTDPEAQAKLDQLKQKITQLQSEVRSIEESARTIALSRRLSERAPTKRVLPQPSSLWEFDNDLNDAIGGLHGTAQGNARLEDGALVLDGASYVETVPIPFDVAEKTLEVWVQLTNLEQQGGAAITVDALEGGAFDAIVFAEREPKRWMPGSDFFRRTDSLNGDEEAEAHVRPVHFAIVYHPDGTIAGYRDGKAYGHSVRKSDLHPFGADSAQILFGLRHKPAGGNHFLTARIHRAAFHNRALTAEEVAASAEAELSFVSEKELVASIDFDQREERKALKEQIAELEAARDIQTQRVSTKIYSLVPAAGATTNVLLRGDPATPGVAVPPGAPAVIAGLSADFSLAPDAPESSRRKKLADWLTDSANPLLARVIVNRVWHYHFGVGIVHTPSDLGFNGGRPSHPELLDYLAIQFQQNGYRLKSLHRWIVNSATYRQSAFGLSKADWQKANSQDTSNRLLWRGAIRRLDAETVRDSMLMTAGKLNLAVGGPSFKDVSIRYSNGTTYYEPRDVDGPTFFRRTVYRFNPRGARSALLDTFDCPDSAFTAPNRSSTTTPLQSLSLMNNSLVLRLSDYFAKRVEQEVGDDTAVQVARAWQLAVARDPNVEERQLSAKLVEEHGLQALCRGLFNFNEFVSIQ